MADTLRPLAVVTGASTGIGFELACCCARDGYDLVIVANEPKIHAAQTKLSALGAKVEAFEPDLATPEGCEQVYAALKGRPVAALLANAGFGPGNGFLDQEFEAWSRVVDTNVMGTLYLIQKIGRDMRARREGKILITGSIAGAGLGGASIEKLEKFGGQSSMGRPGQPAELASIYVQLAASDASYTTGAVYGAAGGTGQP